jgi:hypothetical protein
LIDQTQTNKVEVLAELVAKNAQSWRSL